jgi:hypothetical protein
MVITQKQLQDRRVTKSVYFPLGIMELLEEKSAENGISANKMINLLVIEGLKDDKVISSAVKGKVSSHAPTPAPSEEEPTPEPTGVDLTE